MVTRLTAWLIVAAAILAVLTAPLWMWGLTGEWPAFQGTAVVVWGILPAACLVAWAILVIDKGW